MRALTVVEPGNVQLQERNEPEAHQGDVVIRPVVVGVCGTDLDIIDGTIDPDFVNYPIVIGHEWAGEITQGNDLLPHGSRVVVEGVVGVAAVARVGVAGVNAEPPRRRNAARFGL